MSVTVLMPTYNCGLYISQAIQSILNQTYKNFEFLIIDDGSIDNTFEVISSFNDSRIVYKRIEHGGLSKALNYGLNCASNELIARMDSDDISHPLRFERQLFFSSREKSEIIFTDSAFFLNNKILYTVVNINKPNFTNRKLSLHGHFTHPSVIFHRRHILELGGYNESLSIFEDYDLWLRIKDKSKFIFVNEILQFQRMRESSLTNLDQNYLNKKFYEIQKPYYQDLKSFFSIFEADEQNQVIGWREFFYGNKNLCRDHWQKIRLNEWDYKMFLAYLISFLPSNFVNYFKKQRFRLRLQYLFNSNSKFKSLDKEFSKLLREVSR